MADPEDEKKKRERVDTAEAGLEAAKETAGLVSDWLGAGKLLVAAALIGGAAGTIGGVVGGGASGAAVGALTDRTPDVITPVDAGPGPATHVAPKLRVESIPVGATLLVDGNESGTTPVEVEPAPGAHRLELSAEGFVPYQVDVEIREGVASHVSVSLRPESAEPEPRGGGGGGGGRAARRRRCNDQLQRCRYSCRDSTSYCRDRECSLSDSACQARCDSMERMCREQCSSQFSACTR
jgi:hypothetical protein